MSDQITTGLEIAENSINLIDKLIDKMDKYKQIKKDTTTFLRLLYLEVLRNIEILNVIDFKAYKSFNLKTSEKILRPLGLISTYFNKKPEKKYFDELFRISENQIIWGGNYFIENLKNTSCFIVWDKKNGDCDFADCELAWTSFKSAVRKFSWLWNGFQKEKPEKRFHPTQKPVALYRWLLQNYAKPGDKIIDTHSGSGSLACACHLEKFDFLAIEKDVDYFNDSVKRLDELRSQGTLF